MNAHINAKSKSIRLDFSDEDMEKVLADNPTGRDFPLDILGDWIRQILSDYDCSVTYVQGSIPMDLDPERFPPGFSYDALTGRPVYDHRWGSEGPIVDGEQITAAGDYADFQAKLDEMDRNEGV